MATRNRVPPIDAPAMIAVVGTLLLLGLGLGLGVSVWDDVISAGARVTTRVLSITTSVDEKTPAEISTDETIVLNSTTVDMMDVTMLVGSGAGVETVGAGVEGGAFVRVRVDGTAVVFGVIVTRTVTVKP